MTCSAWRVQSDFGDHHEVADASRAARNLRNSDGWRTPRPCARGRVDGAPALWRSARDTLLAAWLGARAPGRTKAQEAEQLRGHALPHALCSATKPQDDHHLATPASVLTPGGLQEALDLRQEEPAGLSRRWAATTNRGDRFQRDSAGRWGPTTAGSTLLRRPSREALAVCQSIHPPALSPADWNRGVRMVVSGPGRAVFPTSVRPPCGLTRGCGQIEDEGLKSTPCGGSLESDDRWKRPRRWPHRSDARSTRAMRPSRAC